MQTTSIVTGGQCLPPAEWLGRELVLDDSVPIVSGDFVALDLRYESGVTARIIKRLDYAPIHGGRWYGWCLDGVFWLDPTSVVPDRVWKVVSKSEAIYRHRTTTAEFRADERTVQLHAQKTADARDYWQRHGRPLGVPWPGLDAVVGKRPDWARVA